MDVVGRSRLLDGDSHADLAPLGASSHGIGADEQLLCSSNDVRLQSLLWTLVQDIIVTFLVDRV